MTELTPEEKHRLRWKDTAEMEAYKALAALHNTQETIFWTRNNILAVTQTAMVGALFAILVDKDSRFSAGWIAERSVPASFVCVAGWFIADTWLRVVVRTDYLFRTTLRALSRMEGKHGFGIPEQFRAFTLFGASTRRDLDDNEQTDVAKIIRGPSEKESMRLSEIWSQLGRFFKFVWVFALVLIWISYAVAQSAARAGATDSNSSDVAAARNVRNVQLSLAQRR